MYRCSINFRDIPNFFISKGTVKVASQTALNGLYAGGANPGVVYHYLGDTNWNVMSPELGYAVLSLVEYEGYLYAGVMTVDNVGQVWRYDGGIS